MKGHNSTYLSAESGKSPRKLDRGAQGRETRRTEAQPSVCKRVIREGLRKHSGLEGVVGCGGEGEGRGRERRVSKKMGKRKTKIIADAFN